MKKIVHTQDAPQAVGPYSQGVKAGAYFFAAGQVPLDPRSGKLVEGDIRTQTRRVLENLKAVLAAAGCELADVVKTTCFLSDLADFQLFNEVYAEYFPVDPPARSTFQVGALPLGAKVEIELVAFKE